MATDEETDSAATDAGRSPAAVPAEHGPLSTNDGCLLLVTSSLHDEVV